MTAGTALSRVTGLLRVAALTYALGVTGTKLADTYNLANTTPNIIYELFLGGILTAVFVPVLIEARERKRGDPSALVSVSLVALAVVSAIAAFGAPLVMRIYTFRIADPAARAAQLELATFLLRWFAPQILFYGLSGIAQALLNVRGRFGGPAFAPVLNNVIVAGTFIAFARVIGASGLELSTGAKTLLGAGTTAGVVVQALVLLPSLRGLKFKLDVRDPAVTRVLRLSAFIIGYVAVNQAGLWVVLALANGARGGVTAYQVAFILLQLPHGLFAVSIVTALFPDLSRAAANQDWDAYRNSFGVGVRGVFYLLAPAAVGYGLLAEPITRVLLARGVAGVSDAVAVAAVLQAFATGLVFFSAFQLFTRCFFATGDTRTPTGINAVAVAVTTAVNVPMFAWIGVRGLGFGHAIGYATGAVGSLILLARRIPGGLGLGELVAPLARNAVIAAAMGACVWVTARYTPGGDLAVVAVSVGAGAILYLAFSQVAGVEERAVLFDLVRQFRSTKGAA
jgi:putative peptidoglycan lipid II flippase